MCCFKISWTFIARTNHFIISLFIFQQKSFTALHASDTQLKNIDCCPLCSSHLCMHLYTRIYICNSHTHTACFFNVLFLISFDGLLLYLLYLLSLLLILSGELNWVFLGFDLIADCVDLWLLWEVETKRKWRLKRLKRLKRMMLCTRLCLLKMGLLIGGLFSPGGLLVYNSVDYLYMSMFVCLCFHLF